MLGENGLMKNKIIRNIYLVYEGIFLILIELFNQLLIKKNTSNSVRYFIDFFTV